MKKFWSRVFTPNIVLILLFEDGRKAAFGVWGVLLSTWLLLKSLITGDQWFLCFLICGGILTGGTMFDTYIKTKLGGQPNAPTPNPTS